MQEQKSLRFGILCNSLNLQRWQAEIIQMLTAHGHNPSLLVINAETPKKQSLPKKVLRYPWKHLFYRLYLRYVFKPAMKQEVDLSNELKEVPVLPCQTRKVDFSEFFSEKDVAFIRDQNLDFILRFGFNIIRGKILHTAKYGIWSFHHGDEQEYRGGPACFWEIYRNDPVTGAILQQINEKLDAGIILRKGYLGTVDHSYSENLNRVYQAGIPWVLQVCNDILNGSADYFDKPGSTTRAKVYRAPSNFKMILFALKLLRNRITYHFRDLCCIEHWNIGFIKAPVNKVAFNWEAYSKRTKWMPEPKAGIYYADPFVYKLGDVYRTVYEKYNYSRMRASIEQQTLDEDLFVHQPVEVLNNGTHFSFPYLFQHETEVYCVPENASSASLMLYRLSCCETKFEKVTELLPFALIDPVMFSWENRWWLLGTRPGYPSECLYAYYSDELEGPFLAHRNNPVKTDVRSARSAGNPFISGDTLYRPAQNCSITYGGSITVNQLLRLTPDEFIEEVVKEIHPPKSQQYNKGLHTISGIDKITVIDAKKYRFAPLASWSKFLKKTGIKS